MVSAINKLALLMAVTMATAERTEECDNVCTKQCSISQGALDQFYMYNAISYVGVAETAASNLTESLSLFAGTPGGGSYLVNSWATAHSNAASYITKNLLSFQQNFQQEVDEWVDQIRYVLAALYQYQSEAGDASAVANEVATAYTGAAGVFSIMSAHATSCQDCLYWSRSIIPYAETERSAFSEYLSKVSYTGKLGPWASYIECTSTAPSSVPASSSVAPSSAPESSTPASSKPASSVPESSKPASSGPASSSKPASSVPESSKPASSTPVSSAPASSVPGSSSKPASSVPGSSSKPASSVPGSSSKPASSTPLSSAPVSSVPESSKPASSVPESSKPASSTPVSSTPASSVPESSKPASSVPASSTATSTHRCLVPGPNGEVASTKVFLY